MPNWIRRLLHKVTLRIELRCKFHRIEEWESFTEQNPYLFNPRFLRRLAVAMSRRGALEPLTDRPIPPAAIDITSSLREGLAYCLVNSRTRAVLHACQAAIAEQKIDDPKIYAAEAITPFALRMRGVFPKFIGSEHATTEAQRQEIFPILAQDLMALSYGDESFHLVVTNEVLEHVSGIDGAFAEIWRVLKPGGWHVGTVPFLYTQRESIVRAKIEDGTLVHLTEPEYHGNPLDPKGSLVFELPGWNVLDRARAIGFRDAHMKYILSSRYACISEDAGGIFVLCLQK